MGRIKQGGHCQGHVTDTEENDAILDPSPDLIMEFPFCLHDHIDRAMHHADRNDRDPA